MLNFGGKLPARSKGPDADDVRSCPPTVTTDPEVVDARLAVLPVGSFEQHGPHLPLATDTLIAAAVADGIAAGTRRLQLPPLTFSCSHEHADFAGTVSLSATTLAAIMTTLPSPSNARRSGACSS